MSIRNLDRMFRPRSIAVIGASDKPYSVGAALMTNLLGGGFQGPIAPVNPRAEAIHGLAASKDIASLPFTPDLAVIATPPDTVPELVEELAQRGTRAAVILTAGFGEVSAGKERAQQMLAAARPHLLRIIGPNCLGIAMPGLGVNATFAPARLLRGNIAFLTQSGAMATTVLDCWALPRGIGFSGIVSMGDMSDVDFGDLLDWFALDEETHAILIYAEAVTHARKLNSCPAARRAARIKQVIVVKGGRAAEGARAATSHTGALAGADVVYEAAFRRAGMLRVNEVEELFDAAATLSRMSRVAGGRLAIVTNGGGAGVLATDRLIEEGGHLAVLGTDTIAKLNTVLPATWSHANPVDIIGDADAARYAKALTIVMDDEDIDAVVVLYCPTAVASAADAAKGVTSVLKGGAPKKNVFACWMGDASVAEGRAQLIDARVPGYETPERAVRAFMYLVRYRQSQELLLETPSAVASPHADAAKARAILRQALADKREWLDASEVAAFLTCYGIPFARTEAVPNAKAAGETAARMNAPVALKIRSRDVIHKSDVGGVALNLSGTAQVEAAARRIDECVTQAKPKARLEGFIVQEMVVRPGAFELIAGVTADATFGPVILFGQGGTAVEIVGDKSLELPPLNSALARAQIERTRIAALLKGYRGRPAADIDGAVNVLMQLSQIVSDCAEIAELDINPLLCDPAGVIAVDARIRVKAATGPAQARLAIRPYPQHFEYEVKTHEGKRYAVRPIKPEDEPAVRQFADEIDNRDLWHRFFVPLRAHTHETAARLSQIDYDREMALIAVTQDGEEEKEIGVARYITNPDGNSCEFAIVVADAWMRKGIGSQLMRTLIQVAKTRGLRCMEGEVLADNRPMLDLARQLGFSILPNKEDPNVLLLSKSL